MIKVYTQSLGCPKNLVDTEHVLGSLGDFIAVDDLEDADVVFVNTCAFIQSAVEESVSAIVEVATQASEDSFIIVCGCLVGRYGVSELSKEVPEVDLWLETKDIDNWGALTAAAVQEHFGIELSAKEKRSFLYKNTNAEIPVMHRRLSTGPSYAWLKIGEGCRHNCSFCTIPFIRGAYRSVDKEILVPEAKMLVDGGVKELVLVAQDVTAWGSDSADKDLRPLLDKLFALDGLERLRLMYLYPAGMTDTLLNYLKEAGDKFMPYFDIPLQHAHEDILAQMGRPFAQNPDLVVERIRRYFPDAALRTTFIVGFPGETDKHFDRLFNFVDKTRFHQMGVFAYEQEEGTKAALMPNQVEQRVKEARRDELMQLQAEISEEILEEYLGRRMSVIIDREHEEWPGLYVGRTWFQAPDVDGITYISAPEGEEIAPGMIVEADITETQEYDLIALV